MKNNYLRFIFSVFTVVCMLMPATMTAQKVFAKMAKSPVLRTARPQREMDVILLDSIMGETERCYYKYNEFGYLISTKVYSLEKDEYGNPVQGGKWIFDNSEDVSLLSEYTFDEMSRCTQYSEYSFDINEKKDNEVTRIEVTYAGETRTEKYFYYDEETDRIVLYEEIIYDKFGNPSIFKEYDYDDETGETTLDSYEECRYTGNILSYEDCVNGNYDLNIDYDLHEEHCYYELSCDSYSLEGWKIEVDENGKKIRYRIYESDFDISKIDDIDTLWKLDDEYDSDGDVELEIGKENDMAARSAELETGVNYINVTEGDWLYRGEVIVEEVYNEEDGNNEKKIINGELRIMWQGNGRYYYTHPLYNYQFPRGIMDNVNMYDMANAVEMLIAYWNKDENKWEIEHYGSNFIFYKHYKNEKGETVEERSKFEFNQERARMEIVVGTTLYATYSFDEQGRMTAIDNSNGKKCFEYLNDTDYLLKEYGIDSVGNESNVINLYYSTGKYMWPVNNATAVKEVTDASLRIDGNRVMAEGDICIFNTCGQVIGKGKDVITISQKGIYIIKSPKTIKKIYIK